MPALARMMVGSTKFPGRGKRSEEHTSELQSHLNLVCRLLLEKKKYARAAHQNYWRESRERIRRVSIAKMKVVQVPKRGADFQSVQRKPLKPVARYVLTRLPD